MKLFTITYADGQSCPFTEYRNRATEKLHRFEYNPVLDIVANHLEGVHDDEFVGIFSHKFEQKTRYSKDIVSYWCKRNEFEKVTGPEYDLINFSPNYTLPIARKYGSFMDWSAAGHGELLRDLIKACCAHVGFTYHNEPPQLVYANFFAARKRVYVDYVETVVKPCLALMEGPLWHLASQDSNYKGIGQPLLKQYTGLDYYPMLPFVMERLTMQYIVNRDIKTLSL